MESLVNNNNSVCATDELSGPRSPQSCTLEDWRKRFVGEEERDRMISKCVRDRTAAKQRRAEIDGVLRATGDHLDKIARALRSGKLADQDWDTLLRIGPEFPVDATRLKDLVDERERQGTAIEDCTRQLHNLGVE